MEEVVIYLKKFRMAVLIIVAALIAVIFLIKFTIPVFQKVNEINDNYKTQLSTLEDTERRLEDLNKSVQEERAEDEKIIKAFFKSADYNADNETAISEEFSEILELLRDNKVKTRSLKFDPEPADDNFVKNAGDKYFVSKMTAQMIATYSDFESFLRDLYKHEHFIDISSIKIVPYQKNKRILLIDLQVKLYAQKDERFVSSVAPPVNTSNNADNVQSQPSPEKNTNPQSEVQKNNMQEPSFSDDEMTKVHGLYEDKK